MTEYEILYDILIAEGGVLVLLILLTFSLRFSKKRKDKREGKREKILTKYFLDLLLSHKPFKKETYPGGVTWHFATLKVLEQYSKRILDDEWLKIKKSVVEYALHKKATEWVKSRLWTRRNFAVRVFALHAKKTHHQFMLKLMKDRRFLVRMPAIYGLVYQASEKGIERILEEAKKEEGYGAFIYYDAVTNGEKKVFKVLMHLAKKQELKIPILQVLSSKNWGEKISFLEDDLKSPDPAVRKLAYRALVRNPPKNIKKWLRAAIKDEDDLIRRTGYEGFEHCISKDIASLLEKGLEDDEWKVRIAAGRTLLKLGVVGKKILKMQKGSKAKEAAHYVLSVKW